MQQPFSSLPPEEQKAVREAQQRRKLAKKQQRAKCQEENSSSQIQSSQGASNERDNAGSARGFPTCITEDGYFAACAGLFRHPLIQANLDGVDHLLQALDADVDGDGLSQCNYFQFSGSKEAVWDPLLNARLAWEGTDSSCDHFCIYAIAKFDPLSSAAGFFTITESESCAEGTPLPELQPFYGVLLWPNFETSKHVRRELAVLRRKDLAGYRLVNCADPWRTWGLLDACHREKHGVNWLNERYFKMMLAASEACVARVRVRVGVRLGPADRSVS